MPGKGISGLAVGLAAAGGLVMYAGFKGISIVDAIRSVSTGKPAGVSNTGISIAGVDLGTGDLTEYGPGKASNVTGSVAAAASPYLKDKYSQVKRRDSGWSDCSSFVYKIMRDMGSPPTVAWSNTTNYHVDPRLRTIPTAQGMEGDLALSAGHVMILTGGGGTNAPAFGQQNPRENVVSGTLAEYMPKPYVIKRYVSNTKSTQVGNTLSRLGG